MPNSLKGTSATGDEPTSGDRPNSVALDRRELLVAVTATAAAIGLPVEALAQSQSISVAEFSSLANAVAGFPPADPDVSAAFLDAFSDQAAELANLFSIVKDGPADAWQDQIESAGLSKLAEALTLAWYTGMVGDGADKRVITYRDAFAWYAVGYTKPPAHCDVSFGAWSEPPHEDR